MTRIQFQEHAMSYLAEHYRLAMIAVYRYDRLSHRQKHKRFSRSRQMCLQKMGKRHWLFNEVCNAYSRYFGVCSLPCHNAQSAQ